MDTLISLGVLAAFGWSVWALFFGDAGTPGMTMPFSLTCRRDDASEQLYLEVASGVTVLILAGRYLEARAKRRAGAAFARSLELGAKDVAVCDDDGVERRVPIDQLAVGDRFVVRPGEKVATDGTVVEGALGRRRVDAHGRERARRGRPRRSGRRCHLNAGGRLVVRATRVGSDTSWPRWPGWSNRPKPARRPCSVWPTGCRACSCPS